MVQIALNVLSRRILVIVELSILESHDPTASERDCFISCTQNNDDNS